MLLLASFVSLLFVVGVLSAPALICATSFGDTLLNRAVTPYGWHADADRIRVGWLTPLEIDNLRLTGPSGETEISIARLRTGLFATDLMNSPAALGPVELVDVTLRSVVDQGVTTLEHDLQPFLDDTSSGATPGFQISLDKGKVLLETIDAQRQWKLHELEGKVELGPSQTTLVCSLVGQLTNVQGESGSFAVDFEGDPTSGESAIHIDSQMLPLDFVDVLAQRYPSAGFPQRTAGQLKGTAKLNLHDGICRFTTEETILSNLFVRFEGAGNEFVDVGNIRLSGSCATDGAALRGEGFTIASSLGSAAIHGVIDLASIDGVATPWTDLIDGSAELEVDLARASGLLVQQEWVRKDAQVQSGTLNITATSLPGDRNAGAGLRFTGRTTAIRAATPGGVVNLQPISIDAELLAAKNSWHARRIEVRSIFADAKAEGSLRNGNVTFDVDLEKMSRLLSPILQFDMSQLAGRSRGNFGWSVQQDNSWKLQGDANASQLVWQTADGTTIQQPWVKLNVDAFGHWNGERLAELTRAKVGMKDSSQEWTVELTQRVANPTFDTYYPLRALGSGRLDGLEQTLKPWMPAELSTLAGNYEVDIQGEVGRRGGSLSVVKGSVEKASARVRGTQYYQPTVRFYFDGWIDPQRVAFHADLLQVQGSAVAFSAQGSFGPGTQEGLEIAYRADLQLVNQALSDQTASLASTIRQASGSPLPSEGATPKRWLEGQVSGNCWIVGKAGGLRIEGRVDGTKLALMERNGAGARFAGPIRPAAMAAPRQVWFEPTLNASFKCDVDKRWEVFNAESLQLETAWANATLDGQFVRSDKGWELNVSGPAKTDTTLVGRRLASLMGEQIEIEGTSEAPLELRIASLNQADANLEVTGSYAVQWDRAKVAGLQIGAASMPVRLQSDRVQIVQSTYKVNGGTLTLAGDIDIADPSGPIIQLEPGTRAEGVRVDPTICRSWLKYVAPTVANATEVDGVLGFEIDHLVWVSGLPQQSQASGRVRINGARVGPGPMVRDVVATVNALRAAAGRSSVTDSSRQWLDLPHQDVEFELKEGRIRHQRLSMRIGDVQLVSTGDVTMAGMLDLDVQVPIRPEWVEKQPVLASYGGQSLVLPVDGTLGRPSLDSSGVRQLLSEIGTRAIEDTARNAIERELSRGIQKLFGQ